MRKIFLSAFLTLVMVLMILTNVRLNVGAEGELEVCLDNIIYKLCSSDNHAEVIGVKDKKTFSDITILEEIENNGIKYIVTVISDYAISDCKNLKSVKMPNSIKKNWGWSVSQL